MISVNFFTLLNYLETPIEDGKIIDLINLFYYDDSYEDKLSLESRKIFDRTYGKCYYFYILDGDKEIFGFGNFHSNNEFERRIKVPVFNKDLDIVLNPTQYYKLKDKDLGRCEIE